MVNSCFQKIVGKFIISLVGDLTRLQVPGKYYHCYYPIPRYHGPTELDFDSPETCRHKFACNVEQPGDYEINYF
jgi:hypothetical protein